MFAFAVIPLTKGQLKIAELRIATEGVAKERSLLQNLLLLNTQAIVQAIVFGVLQKSMNEQANTVVPGLNNPDLVVSSSRSFFE